ncbi:TIGR02466 family protein [Marinibaculum pumilum]|uniref:TIGR02466 family protein n=1 Tax=Marinibaculum pumilum TaxID=1766165 RepID=A0ABV7KXU5_9PROT
MAQPITIKEFQPRAYFPTPVALVSLANAERLNADLKRIVLEREAQDSGGTEHSNLGGWQSDWELADWGGPPAQVLLQAARAAADRLTGNRMGQPVKVEWKMNAWANINRTGHANEFHTHPGAYWSGAYYVEDGGIGEDPSLGGEFELQDPRGIGPAMYAPNLAFTLPGMQSVGASELISPRAGNMLIFPAWLSHAVRPYRGKGMRISIAFNMSV